MHSPPAPPGKSWGTISVKGVLYSWVIPDNPDLSGYGHTYRYSDDRDVAYPRSHYDAPAPWDPWTTGAYSFNTVRGRLLLRD